MSWCGLHTVTRRQGRNGRKDDRAGTCGHDGQKFGKNKKKQRKGGCKSSVICSRLF